MRQERTSTATRIGALTVAQIRSAALETRLCHYLLKIVGEDARLLCGPPARGEHDEGDDRIERVVGQHFRERARHKLLRAHPYRRDADAEAGGGARDDARGRPRIDSRLDRRDLGSSDQRKR